MKHQLATSMFALALVSATAAAVALGTAKPGPGIQRLTDMPQARAAHSATRLGDGRVLLAGGCRADGCEEGITRDALLFDAGRLRFTATGPLTQPRVGHRAVRLKDGSVLLIGGWTNAGATATIERYDHETGKFNAYGRLLTARDAFTATPLHDGNILIVGGYASDMRRLAQAELYDPRTRKSKAVGNLAVPRKSHTATLMPDGRVLIVGGSDTRSTVTDSLELYDPATASFSLAGKLKKARQKHAAVLLDGNVLILGGAGMPESAAHFADTELWRTLDRRTVAGPNMAEGRYKFLDTVVVLPDGNVLVTGNGQTAELLDRSSKAFTPVEGTLGRKLAFSTATPLSGGRVLIVGGYDPSIKTSRGAWLYRAPRPRL